MPDRSATIEKIVRMLLMGEKKAAGRTARKQWPFVPVRPQHRRHTPVQSTRLFVRDGFIDRYSGRRLIFPGMLRLLSLSLPEEFPFQKNWKTSETHAVYWELFPTVDHIIPLSRGGTNDEGNTVTTSMLRNAAKSNWTLQELGWTLLPPGGLGEWDGLSRLFIQFAEQNQDIVRDPYLKQWYNAARKVLTTPARPHAGRNHQRKRRS